MTVSVFVASRFGEYEHLRRALVARVHAAPDLIAVDLDDGQAADADVLSRSLSAVESSDVMVLVLGASYAEQPLADGRSVTEREYEQACAVGIPVLAFAPPALAFQDERASHFAESVMGDRVLGTLLPDVQDSCDRILDSLADHFRLLDQLADARGDVHGVGAWLPAELEELGAGHFAVFTPSADFTAAWQSYTKLLEQRRLALSALAFGQPGSARRHIAAAHECYEGDWGVEYIAARLTAARGLRSDRAAALQHARRALRILDGGEQPVDEPALSQTTRERRRVACLLALIRLHREAGDVRTAEDLLRQVRKHTSGPLGSAGFSGRALHARLSAERVRTLGASGPSASASATQAFLDVLHHEPELALRLVNSQSVDPVREPLHMAGVQEVARLLERAARLGSTAPTSHPDKPRLRDVVDGARSSSRAAEAELRFCIEAVDGLLMSDNGEQLQWTVDVRARRLQALEDEHSRLVSSRATADLRRTAAREAFDRSPHEQPDRSGLGAGVRSSPSGPTSDAKEPPAQLAPADVLAVETRRLREVTSDLEQLQASLAAVPEPRLPTGSAFKAFCVGGVLLVLFITAFIARWLSWSQTIWQLLLALPLVPVLVPYRTLWWPLVHRPWLSLSVRRAQARHSALTARVEKLRELVDADHAFDEIDSRIHQLEAERAAALAAHQSAQEAQRAVSRLLARSPATTGPDLVQSLVRRVVRHNEAFAEHPAVWWPEYVEPEDAAVGALTRVAPHHAAQGGLLGRAVAPARLVRVLEAGRTGLVVSDLLASFPHSRARVLELEAALEPLVLTAASAASPSR